MTPEDRRRTIVVLLDHWPDFFEPTRSTGLANASTTESSAVSGWVGPSISPLSRDKSVIELRRCVVVLRDKMRVHYNHLRGFYCAEFRLIDRACKRRDHRGRMVDDVERVRDRIVPPWVELRIVDNATDVVSGLFRGQPQLPAAFTRRLRPLADSDGWTEAA